MGSDYISNKTFWIPHSIPDFPFYFSMKNEEIRNRDFISAI